MAIVGKDEHILTSFPRSPQTASAPSRKSTSPHTSPGHGSDFDFIEVGLDTSHTELPLTAETIGNNGHEPALTLLPPALPSSNSDDLQLVLDGPAKLYASGEMVTGYILGWTPSSHIHIILAGRVKTYVRTDRGEYENRAPLIYNIIHLKPKDQSMVPRFSIQIPDKVQSGLEKVSEIGPAMKKYWTHEWPDQHDFESHAGHPLPPSMKIPLQISYNPLVRLTASADVTYKVTAIRSRPNPSTSRLASDASCSISVHLTTSRLPPSKLRVLSNEILTSTSNLSIRSRLLAEDRQPSIGDYFRDTFSSATPTFFFAPSVSIPKFCSPGSELPVRISLYILPPPAGKLYNFPVPNIRISYFTCHVRSYTGVRVLCPLVSPSSERVKWHIFKSSVLEQRQDLKGVVFEPRDGAFEGQKCVFSVKVPGHLTPGFRTWNLWRGYQITVELGFQIKGREERVSVRSGLDLVAV